MQTGNVSQPTSQGRPTLFAGALALATVVVSLVWMGGAVAGATNSEMPGFPAARYQGGAQVSDGVRTVIVSQSSELQPGQPIAVNGAGFDINKGVYVGLCLVPPAGAVPSPCAGGEDRSGSSGASAWFSSNPPSYATNIAVPYAQGGSFSAQLTVSPELGGGLDCRQVQCAIATRNDHTRSTDRSQDLFIPVTFAAGPPAEAPQPTAPPAPVEEPVQATIAELPLTPQVPLESPAASKPTAPPTTRPKVTTTLKPKQQASSTTVTKTTTTKPKATTTSVKPTTTTAPERSEEPKITVSSNDGGSGGWGWGLAAAGGVALLGGAGAGIYRSKTGRWPGMNAPTDATSAP